MLNQFFYRRNLPHWIPRNANLFVTWRLHGSLPKSAQDRLDTLNLQLDKTPKPKDVDSIDWELRKRKKMFTLYDQLLDEATDGPHWLKDPEVANIVQDALINKYSTFFTLPSYSVMSNHCHALLKPKLSNPEDERSAPIAFAEITKRIKGYSAREANKILGRTGLKFWQDESFDHWIRNPLEFDRVVEYIESNPVKAGLVKRPEDWEWSSASERVRRGWDTVRSLT
jgi:REP element-mobilizing transposase RayT